MAGHSHWAGIKHRKAAADAKKGKIFSKLAKYVTVAARSGGDPDMNAALRLAIDTARAQNMTKDAIERAIKKGTGELAGITYVDLVYEGFAPDNVALVVDILTDNRNRTASELRTIFEKKGGILGSPGSVAWMFVSKGILHVPKSQIAENELMELVLDAGGEDLAAEDEYFEIHTPPENFNKVRTVLVGKGLTPIHAEIGRLPTTTVRLDSLASAERVLAFISELEDHDDVKNIAANYDIPAEIFSQLS